ncbi:DUF4352 domain-containing protein [Numidum massiliense]|uniref:DUF4352 domain-containing protein n=1 Tax=Numidum massiliense TaxID=1522315 RepID=UPI0006D58F19|nr:DUF4352 domain-containing protein [Numidum massiliense]
MQRMFKVMLVLVFSLILLVGCSGGEGASKKDSGDTQASDGTKDQAKDKGKSKGSGEQQEKEDGLSAKEDPDDEDDGELPSGDVKDQLGLKIGETGLIESAVGKNEITLNSAKYANKVGDEEPFEDVFLILDVTVKNVGDKNFDASEVQGSKVFTEEKIAYDNQADLVKGIKALKGDLAPGKSASGELLFDIEKTGNYRLVFGEGLGTVMNKVEFEFDGSEVK